MIFHALLALLAVSAHADAINLKGGAVLQGVVTAVDEDAVVVRIKKDALDSSDYRVSNDTAASTYLGTITLKDGRHLRGSVTESSSDTVSVRIMRRQIWNADYIISAETSTPTVPPEAHVPVEEPAGTSRHEIPAHQKDAPEEPRQCADIRAASVPAMLSFFEHCARHVDLQEQASPADGKRILVAARRYDERGRHIGNGFTIVHIERGSPVVSFDVIDSVDFERSLRAFRNWTRRGFELGWKVSRAFSRAVVQGFLNNQSSAPVVRGGPGKGAAVEAAILLAAIISPAAIDVAGMLAGTAGGAVIGFADGMRLSVAELSRMLSGKRERLISYTVYTYDTLGRLTFIRQYSGNRGKELVRTEFYYTGISAVPARSKTTELENEAPQTEP